MYSLSLLQPLPIVSAPFIDISMDFIEGLFESNDKKVNFMVVDKFNKYTSYIALAHSKLMVKMITFDLKTV